MMHPVAEIDYRKPESLKRVIDTLFQCNKDLLYIYFRKTDTILFTEEFDKKFYAFCKIINENTYSYNVTQDTLLKISPIEIKDHLNVINKNFTSIKISTCNNGKLTIELFNPQSSSTDILEMSVQKCDITPEIKKILTKLQIHQTISFTLGTNMLKKRVNKKKSGYNECSIEYNNNKLIFSYHRDDGCDIKNTTSFMNLDKIGFNKTTNINSMIKIFRLEDLQIIFKTLLSPSVTFYISEYEKELILLFLVGGLKKKKESEDIKFQVCI